MYKNERFRIDSSMLHLKHLKNLKFFRLTSFTQGLLHFGHSVSVFRIPFTFTFKYQPSMMSLWPIRMLHRWGTQDHPRINQSPLHYRLSGSIGKKKFLFQLACVYSFLVEFWWNFLCWCKTVNILQKNIFRQILYKNMSFF